MGKVSFAVAPEIQVGGPKFLPSQLAAISQVVGENAQIELTTLQQLIIEMDEENAEEAKKALKEQGLLVYQTGSVVKNLSTCAFCKGAEIEGLETARQLNRQIVGGSVPFTLRVGYTGCPNACGEPLLKDIGIVKRKDTFDVYIGGQSKTLEAQTGQAIATDLNEDELYQTVNRIITIYQQNGKKREKFSEFIDRHGMEHIRSLLKEEF